MESSYNTTQRLQQMQHENLKPVIIQEDDAEFLNATFDSGTMSDGVGHSFREIEKSDPVEAKK